MTKRGKGVIFHGDKNDPVITGYLILGDDHYQIIGERVSDIRTNLHIRQTVKTEIQEDLFDEPSSAAGQRKCDSP